MPYKEGDRVRIVTRTVTAEDRKLSRYFDHMAGLSGEVTAVYSASEIAVQIDEDALKDPALAVRTEAVRRMREKFLNSVGEEGRSRLAPEELNFNANYVLIVREEDLERI